ncbi:cytochrome c [Tepidamorphus gemmatus]|jgi:cytochrome c|uniref:Cytochrome c n=1 Tax=Tepidamorphus gemmatus TaxID=747076 RepID=A0A4R3MBK1_9HYPH|nr:cytochrome c family protein [Tepidamorphus gemmatus]TCT08825.1 cytochrome c [Tepidamorphus gemmatus]
MDSFEFNKFAGAILLTLLVTLGVSILAEELYTAHTPEKPGYEVAVAEEEAGEAEAEAEEVVPLGVLLASADVQRGEAQARKCVACHTFDEGGANKVGPNLWEIVGRTIASHEGFSYSAAMREHVNAEGNTWTYENLDHFLANPREFMPGTAMAFAGLRRADERADLLAYLQTLSSNPVPFPAADDAAGSGGAPAAAETAAPPTTQ